ncbi:MAG: STAS domain-containing protein [Elusimicrobia bacterium]|nr:STAS domain-containing protein [Elusimicrobiota bacterium]
MFNIAKADGRLVVTFPERMDTLACEQHAHRIDEEVSQAQEPVTFDLAGVIYVSSSFLRICLRTAQAAGQDRFAMANVAPEVRKVFKIAGLESCLAIR